jgi:hypothetical protein
MGYMHMTRSVFPGAERSVPVRLLVGIYSESIRPLFRPNLAPIYSVGTVQCTVLVSFSRTRRKAVNY